MPLVDQSKRKIKHALGSIADLLDGDFPISAGRRALERLARSFRELDNKLDRATRLQDNEAIDTLSGQVNSKVYQTLPTMGFILRSTNVRNAFELLEPFQNIADRLLQGKPKIILSSEWDYIPFAYPQSLEDLGNFVLIGMPATEASNSLLSPLAAHELGHAVWRNRGLSGSVSTTLQFSCEANYEANMTRFKAVFKEYDEKDMVGKEVLPVAIGDSVDFAVLHAEEIFCDMFAYCLFGISYLYAFAYILSPGTMRTSSAKYPTYGTRISTLQKVGAKHGKSLPSVADLGLTQPSRLGYPQDRFIIEMAEESVAKITDALWNIIEDDLFKKLSLETPADQMAEKHLQEFRLGVPGFEPRCMGDVVNAGWRFYHEDILQIAKSEVADEKFQLLNELVFKTLEVYEYSRRVKHGT